MTDHTETQDYFNLKAPVIVESLSTTGEMEISRVTGSTYEAAASQVFRMKLLISTEKQNPIRINVLGLASMTMDAANPEAWDAEHIRAPHKQPDLEIPSFSFTQFPKGLRDPSGENLEPRALASLIEQQLGRDLRWRTSVAEQLPEVTADLVKSHLQAANAITGEPQADSLGAQETEIAEADSGSSLNEDQDDISRALDALMDEDDESLVGDQGFDLSEKFDALDGETSEDEMKPLTSYEMIPEFPDEDDSAHTATEQGVTSSLSALTSTNEMTEDQASNASLGSFEATNSELEMNDGHDISEVVPETGLASEDEASQELLGGGEHSPAPVTAPENRTITVQTNEGPDFEFCGRQLGELATASGNSTATLHISAGGSVIAGFQSGSAKVYTPDNVDALFEVFGYSPEAKEVYREAGIKCTTWID